MTNEEFDKLVEGSVVLFGNRKVARIVREVSPRHGRNFYVYFAIKRCSWTKRPYTLYHRHEILKLCEFTGMVVDIPEFERGAFRFETRNNGKPRTTCHEALEYA